MDWNVLSASASALVPDEALSDLPPVVNLFKLSKDWTNIAPKITEADGLLQTKHAKTDDVAVDQVDTAYSRWCDKDLELWDRDKAAILETLEQRLKENAQAAEFKRQEDAQAAQTQQEPVDEEEQEASAQLPHVALSTELEMLISWLDRYPSVPSANKSQSHAVFLDNVFNLAGQTCLDLAKFLLDVTMLANAKNPDFFKRYLKTSLKHLQRHAWQSVRLAVLNANGLHLEELMSLEPSTAAIEYANAVKCAEIFFPDPGTSVGINSTRDPEFFFFIAYLLFRCGSSQGLDILIGKSGISVDVPFTADFPPLFVELCELLRDLLLSKENENRYLLLGRFTGEYFTSKGNAPTGLLGRGSNFYALLLLSIVYADSYSPCEPELLFTKEDYVWYQIHIWLASSASKLCVSAASLCLDLSKDMRNLTASDVNVVDRILAHAYSMALVGGLKECLRLLMSAISDSKVQAFALVAYTLLELSSTTESPDLNYIGAFLWNLEDCGYSSERELPYLAQLAFSRKRLVSPELKILLATLLPANKANLVMKYVISENFSSAINTCFLGSAATRNGMLAIGPLLQKLMKLSTKRASAKLAISLLAQYSAHLGLWCSAFKCFYCTQDAENCACKFFIASLHSTAVLEACCCFLYDEDETSSTKLNISREDLVVYYALVRGMAPTNQRVLALKNIFDCIKLSVLASKGEFGAAIAHARSTRVFHDAANVLRNESHSIYFGALVDYIVCLKTLVNDGQQPGKLLTVAEAHMLVDLLESAHQNVHSNKEKTMEAIHMLMTFITIVPPKA